MAIINYTDQLKYTGKGYLDSKMMPVNTFSDLQNIPRPQRFEGLTITVLNNGNPQDYWLIGGTSNSCWICAECSASAEGKPEGVVVPANYNCEGQVVISGSKEAVEAACVKMKEAGARRALPLPVGGAFHSPLMEPARAELAEGIEKATFHTPICPIYQNVTAKPSTDPDEIKANLLTQLTAPVRWTQSVQNMLADGATHFVELGPGKVLQGLISKTAGSDITIEGFQTSKI